MKWRTVARVGWLLIPALLWLADSARAQAPIAFDDSYDVSSDSTLEVEAIGVLENDTDALGEDLQPGVSAQLVDDASHGTLALASDGSFSYDPPPGFLGIDSFSYRVVDGASTSNVAVVTLDVRGCAGALPLLTCWVESEYIAELTALGYATYGEGFEEAAVWPLTPSVASSVTSLGITWSPNYAAGGLTTGSGPALSGSRGAFSLPHGDTTGAPFDPVYDGFTGTAAGTLIGVGGWLESSMSGAQVQFILSSPASAPVVVDFDDPTLGYLHRFFGAIDTRGFTTFQIVETEGVVEDQKFVFGDDFTFAVIDAPECGDGLDNDGDGFADFPLDPGCRDASDAIEDPQCQDGIANDGDGLIDFDGGQSIHGACANQSCPTGVSDPDLDGVADPDPQCVSPWRNREQAGGSCGLGFELSLLIPLLAWGSRRQRRAISSLR
ncbi:MAG: hypothetical protein GY723_21340 [bacterium]|nr:hypothetical protein [bacterium]MCP5065500.1 hypothetical protein [bacterium]